MVTLYNPLLHNGRIIPAGSSVTLPESLEKKIIEEGNGCDFQAETPAPITLFDGDGFDLEDPPAIKTDEVSEENAIGASDPEETLGRVGRGT